VCHLITKPAPPRSKQSGVIRASVRHGFSELAAASTFSESE
jgi:hypothetical protein